MWEKLWTQNYNKVTICGIWTVVWMLAYTLFQFDRRICCSIWSFFLAKLLVASVACVCVCVVCVLWVCVSVNVFCVLRVCVLRERIYQVGSHTQQASGRHLHEISIRLRRPKRRNPVIWKDYRTRLTNMARLWSLPLSPPPTSVCTRGSQAGVGAKLVPHLCHLSLS